MSNSDFLWKECLSRFAKAHSAIELNSCVFPFLLCRRKILWRYTGDGDNDSEEINAGEGVGAGKGRAEISKKFHNDG